MLKGPSFFALFPSCPKTSLKQNLHAKKSKFHHFTTIAPISLNIIRLPFCHFYLYNFLSHRHIDVAPLQMRLPWLWPSRQDTLHESLRWLGRKGRGGYVL